MRALTEKHQSWKQSEYNRLIGSVIISDEHSSIRNRHFPKQSEKWTEQTERYSLQLGNCRENVKGPKLVSVLQRFEFSCVWLVYTKYAKAIFRFSSVKELEKSIPDIEKQLNLAKADHTKARAADEQVMEKVIGRVWSLFFVCVMCAHRVEAQVRIKSMLRLRLRPHHLYLSRAYSDKV